jgi:hypothetical protein
MNRTMTIARPENSDEVRRRVLNAIVFFGLMLLGLAVTAVG